MGARPLIAIEIGRHQLRAVHAIGHKDRLTVAASICVDRPEDLDLDDTDAAGAWVRDVLTEAGLPKGSAIAVLAREHVVLKRLVLPTTVDAELPEMTRLALQREIPFDPEQAVIDYMPIDRDASSTRIMAVAAPRGACDRLRAVVESAGWKVSGIALRTMGALALLRDLDGDSGSRFIVDVTPGGVEFSVARGGEIQFARGAELPPDLVDPDAIADALRTEARRTWMSYRVGDGSSEVDRADVLGDVNRLASVATTLTEMLKCPAQVLTEHPVVDAECDCIDRVWPLVGLLLDAARGRQTFDFAHPRRPVSRRDTLRRQGILVGSLILVLGLLGFALGTRHLSTMNDRHAELTTEFRTLVAGDNRFYRERFRYQHLQYWERMSTDWLAHLLFFDGMLPDQSAVVLDTVAGALTDSDVEYDDKAEGNKWRGAPSITFVLEGEARDRVTADALRDALVQLPWLTAESSGSDSVGGKRHPFGFTYRLTTRVVAPPVAEDDS